MKKSILILSVIATITACKKSHTCECTVAFTYQSSPQLNYTETYTETITNTKSQAKKDCESKSMTQYANSGYEQAQSCKLKN